MPHHDTSFYIFADVVYIAHGTHTHTQPAAPWHNVKQMFGEYNILRAGFLICSFLEYWSALDIGNLLNFIVVAGWHAQQCSWVHLQRHDHDGQQIFPTASLLHHFHTHTHNTNVQLFKIHWTFLIYFYVVNNQLINQSHCRVLGGRAYTEWRIPQYAACYNIYICIYILYIYASLLLPKWCILCARTHTMWVR